MTMSRNNAERRPSGLNLIIIIIIFFLYFLNVYFFISLQAVTYLLGSQKVSVSLRCLSLWWFYYIIISVCDYLRLWAHYLASWWLCMWYLCMFTAIMKKPQSSYEVQVICDWTFCRSQTVGLCGWLGVIMVVYIMKFMYVIAQKMLGSPWRLHHSSMCHFSKWVACYRDLSWGSSQGLNGASETTHCWSVTLRSSSSKRNRVHSVPSRLLSQNSSKVTKHVVSRVFRLVSWNL